MADRTPQLPSTTIVQDPFDRHLADYSQAMQVLVDLNGDGIPDAVMPITNRERRGVQRRAMAGLEPTPEQAAGLAADMPHLEANSERLGNVGLELTGMPQAGRAVASIGEAYDDPSLANLTNAGVQSALAAFRPLLAAKVAGAGFAGAGTRDLLSMGARAAPPKRGQAQSESVSLPGLSPEQNQEYNNLQVRLQRGDFGSRADRIAVQERVRELRGISDDFARGRNTASQEEYTRTPTH